MATHDPLYSFMPYGAPELREAAPRFQIRSLGLSCALAAALFAALAVVQVVSPHAQRSPGAFYTHDVTVLTERPLRIEPPPPLEPAGPSRPAVPDGPLPVPVISADPEVASDLPQASGGDGAEHPVDLGGPGEPGGTPGGEGLEPETTPDPGPGVYVHTDTAPVLVMPVVPEYPDIARQAGVEGRVVMQVKVGVDGRVREVRGTLIQVPMLNEAARAACWKLVFTPATVDGHPIAVWTAIPFDFRLH